ncbi:hypothetical protein ACFL30_03170 [Candidatus Latescibacterota bacterium]
MKTKKQIIETATKRGISIGNKPDRFFEHLQEKGEVPLGERNPADGRSALFPDWIVDRLATLESLRAENKTHREIRRIIDGNLTGDERLEKLHSLCNALGILEYETVTGYRIQQPIGEEYYVIAIFKEDEVHVMISKPFDPAFLPEKIEIMDQKSMLPDDYHFFYRISGTMIHDYFGKPGSTFIYTRGDVKKSSRAGENS